MVRHIMEVAVFAASGLGLLMLPGYAAGWPQLVLAALYWFSVRGAVRDQPRSVARIYRRNTLILLGACLLALLGHQRITAVLLLGIGLVILVRSRNHGHPYPARNDVPRLLTSF